MGEPKPNPKLRVGGLKVIEAGSCLVYSSPGAEFRLGPQVTGPLTQNKINITFLTHVAGDRTSLGIARAEGETSLARLKNLASQEDTFRLQPDTAIMAVYPHDKRPEIIGAFIRSLARSKSVLYGLASSPSAITGIIEARREVKVASQLFQDFQFSSFASAEEFFAAQEIPEEYHRKVVATYQEKRIKVYWIVPQSDLDLWAVSIPSDDILGEVADILTHLGDFGLTIPFLIAIPRLRTGELLFAFSTSRPANSEDQGDSIRRLLNERLPGLRPMRLIPVAGIFLHGPHFGDRYGIVNALVEALEDAHVSILALSCTISSISVIIRQHELAPALLVLGQVFEAPVS
jgi:aspartokinase